MFFVPQKVPKLFNSQTERIKNQTQPYLTLIPQTSLDEIKQRTVVSVIEKKAKAKLTQTSWSSKQFLKRYHKTLQHYCSKAESVLTVFNTVWT